MSQNSSKIKLETERRCQNERCGADISHLHGNAKHCDNLCWMIHQAIDEDRERAVKKMMYEKQAETIIECYDFLHDMKNAIISMKNAGLREGRKVSFRFVLDWLRYIDGYSFSNPIQKYIKAEFSKQYPEMMRYIK